MWKEHLILAPGESLRFDERHDKGNLGQEEVERHSIVDSLGNVSATVQFTDHMSIKAPFVRSLHLIQRTITGAIVVDKRWNPE